LKSNVTLVDALRSTFIGELLTSAHEVVYTIFTQLEVAFKTLVHEPSFTFLIAEISVAKSVVLVENVSILATLSAQSKSYAHPENAKLIVQSQTIAVQNGIRDQLRDIHKLALVHN